MRHRATHRNPVWSYDFLTERTEDGRQLRILVVIDEFTWECLAIEVARSFTACDVIMTLQYLFAVRGAPEHLRSDIGPEFVAKEIQEWLARACVRTLYIQKASPWGNRRPNVVSLVIENNSSFLARLRPLICHTYATQIWSTSSVDF